MQAFGRWGTWSATPFLLVGVGCDPERALCQGPSCRCSWCWRGPKARRADARYEERDRVRGVVPTERPSCGHDPVLRVVGACGRQPGTRDQRAEPAHGEKPSLSVSQVGDPGVGSPTCVSLSCAVARHLNAFRFPGCLTNTLFATAIASRWKR